MDVIKIIDGYIQLKHGTSTEWSTENPVLLAWELGLETDTRKCKIGDGITPWNLLDYAFPSGYTLPIASSNELGGIKVGTNLSIDSGGVLSATDTTYTIESGSANGTISVNGSDVSVTGLGSNAFSSTNYLPLSGGTLTGDVTITKANPTINLNSSTITKGTNPSSDATVSTLAINDKNGTQLQRIYGYLFSNGTSAITIRATKNVSTLTIAQVSMRYPASGDPFFVPGSNNTVTLGSASLLWKEIFSSSGTINTSDERLKDNITPIPDEVLNAWEDVGWYQFRFKDSIAKKGENARTHCGLIAQRIKEVFERHNLDAFKYGLICYDEWDAQDEVVDENGEILEEAIAKGSRYSLRYEEALCMESAYQRRRADRLEERIEALEKLYKEKGER